MYNSLMRNMLAICLSTCWRTFSHTHTHTHKRLHAFFRLRANATARHERRRQTETYRQTDGSTKQRAEPIRSRRQRRCGGMGSANRRRRVASWLRGCWVVGQAGGGGGCSVLLAMFDAVVVVAVAVPVAVAARERIRQL